MDRKLQEKQFLRFADGTVCETHQATQWAMDYGGTCYCDACGAHYQCRRCRRFVHQEYNNHNNTHVIREDEDNHEKLCEMSASEKKNVSRNWHWEGSDLVTDSDSDEPEELGFRAKLTGLY